MNMFSRQAALTSAGKSVRMDLIGARCSPACIGEEERYSITSLSNTFKAGTNHVSYDAESPFAVDGIDVAIKATGSPVHQLRPAAAESHPFLKKPGTWWS